MNNKYLDLLLVVAIIALNVAWSLLKIHVSIVSIVLALPLVFLFPGYTLAKVLFYKKILDKTHLLILSIGLSIVLSIVDGFILNMFSFGLQAVSWVISLGSISCLFSVLSLSLRQNLSVNIGFSKWRTGIRSYVLIGIALIVVVSSFLYSAINQAQQPNRGFTQFWMLPSKQANQSCNLQIGINSFEAVTTTYRIVMLINGTQATNWTSVVLNPQQEWKQSVPLNISASNLHIEARLYRTTQPNVMYREVHITLNRSANNKDQKLVCTI